jgi:GMP synthase-like glutamine amidotransferase
MDGKSKQIVDKSTPITVHKNFCFYEPIVPEIHTIRVLTIDSLVKTPEQYSDVARSAPDFDAEKWCKLERKIAGLALANIESNIERLVVNPVIQRAHFTELTHELTRAFGAEAIVLSGTLRDFDFYEPHLFDAFNEFIRTTSVPVLAICGGHQMVGQAFGANIITLDEKLPSERRTNRQVEYQYRFVTITDESDPIFANLNDQPEFDRWHKYSKVLRVWQNHGLQLDRLPDGFKHLARGYLSEQQMMVRRTAEQLIYGVQFHIEKSFQDFQLDNYWAHRVESRDGRMIFENFMIEALRFLGKSDDEIFSSDSERIAKLKKLAEEQAENDAMPGDIKQSGW